MLSQYAKASYFGEDSEIPVKTEPIPDTTTTPSIDVVTINPSLIAKQKLRVMICGTHPRLFSGYANVVHNLVRRLVKHDDLDITLFAFQNFKQNNIPREDLTGITVFDCFAHEDGKKAGFGESLIGDYLKEHPQDVVIIYNDASVVSMLVQNIREKLSVEERAQIRFICYLDQVYKFQKEKYVRLINDSFNEVVAFTEHWRTFIKTQLRPDMPVDILPHGFDSNIYYPIDKNLCRLYYNIPEDAFVVLTLNRCQPRKRLDHLCQVMADVVQRHQDLKAAKPDKTYRPLKLLIGTALQGCWDLPELLSWEFKRRGMKPELINDYIIAVARPQQLSDKEVNILYNAADCGLHCVDGEGMGLCALEHMGIGCPQVANNVGGFKEFMTAGNSILVDPAGTYYVDTSRDGIGGLAETCNVDKMADGVWKMYMNPAMVRKLGRQARNDVLTHFKWDVIADRLYRIIKRNAT